MQRELADLRPSTAIRSRGSMRTRIAAGPKELSVIVVRLFNGMTTWQMRHQRDYRHGKT
jgi:hypothetical protein